MNSLENFSNDEIEARLKTLVLKERQLLHFILEHIKEVDSRKLYLERAYSSLYEYLVKEFKYSGSAAMRRIEAARLLREVPMISIKIQEGALNLTQIGELSRAVKEKEKISKEKVSALEKQDLLEKIVSKTTQDTQKELAQALDLQLKDYDSQRVQKDESVRLEITLSKEQFEMLSKCRDLASRSLSQNQMSSSWGDVLEIVMAHFLNSRDGSNCIENRELHNPAMSKCGQDSNSKGVKSPLTSKRVTSAPVLKCANKTLTPKTRKFILSRDKCCQYKDLKTGKICGSTYTLQVDHKTSRWAEGDHSITNLQTLCAAHNQLKYRKELNLKVSK